METAVAVNVERLCEIQSALYVGSVVVGGETVLWLRVGAVLLSLLVALGVYALVMNEVHGRGLVPGRMGGKD